MVAVLTIIDSFGNELRSLYGFCANQVLTGYTGILGSFAQINCFSRAVAYLDSGKGVPIRVLVNALLSYFAVNVKPMVTDVFKLEDFQKALDTIASRKCLKVAIAPVSSAH